MTSNLVIWSHLPASKCNIGTIVKMISPFHIDDDDVDEDEDEEAGGQLRSCGHDISKCDKLCS